MGLCQWCLQRQSLEFQARRNCPGSSAQGFFKWFFKWAGREVGVAPVGTGTGQPPLGCAYGALLWALPCSLGGSGPSPSATNAL